MNCAHIMEKIDSLVFEPNDQMNLEVQVHNKSCESCKAYYEESLLSEKVIIRLRNQDHLLKNPEILIYNILNRIETFDNTDSSTKLSFTSKIIKIDTIQRLLAAASVLLLVVFGYEQFVVVDKILALEEKMSQSTQKAHHFKSYNQLIAYYPKQVSENLISTIEARIQKKKNNKLFSRILLARLGKMDVTEHKQFLPEHSKEQENKSTSETKKVKRCE